ncbi:MAG: hypothetical protein JST31_03745 [Actinobacteria bacterium]|nr:hypothetical protein [Actinomycetota bacterium]
MNAGGISEWQKGGVPYAKLRRIVPEYLNPQEVDAFFVAVNRGGGRARLVNPFTPFQREYVLVATGAGNLVVLALRRPGVFRASIKGIVFDGSSKDAELRWRDGTLFVNRMPYEPISFHEEDAQKVAEGLGL